MNSISKIERNNFCNGDYAGYGAYFQQVMQVALECGNMDMDDMEEIQVQCAQLVASQIEKYTGGQSSSVRIEAANEIAKSALYNIGALLKSLGGVEAAVDHLIGTPIAKIHGEGIEFVKGQVEKAKKLLCEVLGSRVLTDNYAYNDTLGGGIQMFFDKYDVEFAAHDTPASIDYPLGSDVGEDISGVEYIIEYLQNLLYENRFCKVFEEDEVEGLLRGYDPNCCELLVNIFEILFTSALGCIIAGGICGKLAMGRCERAKLQFKLERLSGEQLDNGLNIAFERLCVANDYDDEELMAYARVLLPDIGTRLLDAAERGVLESALPNIENEKQENQAAFIDGNRMEDEEFKKTADEIRECRLVGDKIAMIKRNIGSVSDLAEILEGYCIFEDEFFDVFDSLEDTALAVLLGMLPEHIIDGEYSLTEGEREWQEKLHSYLNDMRPERGVAVRNIFI